MAYWWEDRPSERYWCEITDRDDVGADLKCPQTDEAGKPYWSYGLIRSVWPGDVVYHYSTVSKAFVGASVAGGPLEERAIVWVPHGTVGRSKRQDRSPRPGWWLPLYGYHRARTPLRLHSLQTASEQEWIRAWVETHRPTGGLLAAPVQLYPGKLRAAQGYLTKMPADFVNRWYQLQELADALIDRQEELNDLGDEHPPPAAASKLTARFKPKSDSDYVAIIKASEQHRSRKHETLVRDAGEWLANRGAKVTNPHPKDLELVRSTARVIIEAKVASRCGPLRAIREAVGQLFEYRRFLGPRDAVLCILLDEEPGDLLVQYVEQDLGFLVAWMAGGALFFGTETAQRLPAMAGLSST